MENAGGCLLDNITIVAPFALKGKYLYLNYYYYFSEWWSKLLLIMESKYELWQVVAGFVCLMTCRNDFDDLRPLFHQQLSFLWLNSLFLTSDASPMCSLYVIQQKGYFLLFFFIVYFDILKLCNGVTACFKRKSHYLFAQSKVWLLQDLCRRHLDKLTCLKIKFKSIFTYLIDASICVTQSSMVVGYWVPQNVKFASLLWSNNATVCFACLVWCHMS